MVIPSFSSTRRHTRWNCDWSSDVCSSDLGNFPLRLAPEQVHIIPVADIHKTYADNVYHALKSAGIRVHLDDSNDSMGKKIRAAKQAKIPYFIVIGDKEVEAKNVTIENRSGESKQIDLHALANHVLTEVETKQMS